MSKKLDLEKAPSPVTDEFEWRSRLTFRERLRLYVGGACFIGLGAYIIWKTTLILLGLFTVSSGVNTWAGWPQVKYVFVLYVIAPIYAND